MEPWLLTFNQFVVTKPLIQIQYVSIDGKMKNGKCRLTPSEDQNVEENM